MNWPRESRQEGVVLMTEFVPRRLRRLVVASENS